jgi:PAS domain S-box-containing protein
MQSDKGSRHIGVGLNVLNLNTEHDQVFSKALIDAIPGSFFLLDSNVRLVGWNAYLRDEIIGVSEREMAGLDALQYIHSDDRLIICQKMQRVFEDGTDESAEVRVLQRGGSEFRWRMMTGRRILIDGKFYLVGMGIDISERKKAEESLAASNDRLKLIMSEVHAGSWEWILSSNTFIWSEELWQLFGLDPGCGEASYEQWLQTVVPEERAKTEQALMKAVKKGIELNVSWRVRDNRGKERVFMSKGIPFRGEGGRVIRYVGIVIDITNRSHDEQALRESEERFRMMFESHSAIQLILNPDTGMLIDANQAASNFYGWSIAELKRMNITQINVLPAAVVRQHLDRWNLNDKVDFSFRHRRADGSVRDVDVFGNKIVISGEPHIYCIIHDVTKRKRLESLREFHLRMLEFADVHSVEDFLRLALDETERLLDSQIGFCHFIRDDYPAPSLQVWSTNARNLIDLVEPGKTTEPLFNDTDELLEIIREKKAVIHNGSASVMNSFGWFKHGNAECNRELIIPTVKGGKVDAIFGVGNKPSAYDEEDAKYLVILADLIWDILARKRAEQSEKFVQEALIQSQKMEMVGRLAGGVAHDFNNMLGVILGHSEMALERDDLSRSVHADLKAIRKAAVRSAELTRQLLAFARKQTIIPKVLELNRVVKGMLNMLRRMIGEAITLVWVPDCRPLLVKVDPTQIDQILINLCINARDAITGTGKITIETGMTNVGNTSGDSLFYCSEPGDYVTISVSDNGCGVDPKHLPHIFEPFFTTKEMGKGTGLGLSTVYGIVKQNNGGIECSSVPGKATTFKIHLPRYNELNLPDNSEQPESQNRSKATILLVEDEPEILKICKLMLEQIGYTVLSTSTPEEAIALAGKHKGSIELLVTDIILPEMTGCDLSKKLVSDRPGLKTLFMSGYTSEVITRPEEFNEGVNFIQKPFSFKTLAASVQQMLTIPDSLDFQ